MKAIVFDCLRDLALSAFGEAKWQEIAQGGPLGSGAPSHLAEDHPDDQVLALFARTCELTGLDFPQACAAFGAHWVGTYLPAQYPDVFEGVSSARDFILKLDAIHAAIPQRLPGSRPPRHSYQWKDARTLLIGYESERDLIELFEATLRAVGTHFGTLVTTRIVDRHMVEATFED